MKRFPLIDNAEWDFRELQDDEIHPCCYWEYSRESARICAFFRKNDSKFFPAAPMIPELRGVDGNVFQKAHRSLPHGRMQFSEQLRLFAEPLRFAMQRAHRAGLTSDALDFPWSRLPRSVRRGVVDDLEPYFRKHPWLSFLPFNRCSDMRDLGIANEGYRCAELDKENEIERLRVQIEWGAFTDAQIEHAFHIWVKENRPRGLGRASERGQRKGQGLENQLKWLGMLRLLNACKPSELKKKYPEAARLYNERADWPRARKNANRALHEWYPFLPIQDRPIHWPTAAGRGR